MNNHDWAQRLRENVALQAAHRAKIGDAAYLTERGYDPERYKFQQGMIVARPPE